MKHQMTLTALATLLIPLVQPTYAMSDQTERELRAFAFPIAIGGLLVCVFFGLCMHACCRNVNRNPTEETTDPNYSELEEAAYTR